MEFSPGATLWSDLVRAYIYAIGPAAPTTYGAGGALLVSNDLGSVTLGELVLCNFVFVGNKLVALGYIDAYMGAWSGTASVRFNHYNVMPTHRQWNTPVGQSMVHAASLWFEVITSGTLVMGLRGYSDANQAQTGQNTCTLGSYIIRSV